MPKDESKVHSEDTDPSDTLRKGRAVVKTTLEIDKELYIKMKDEVTRSKKSLREFLSEAAVEKLERKRRSAYDSELGVPLLLDILNKNHVTRSILEIMKNEIPHPFNVAVLISKAERHGVQPDEFTVAALTDDFIDDICETINLISGPGAALKVKNGLIALRRK